MNKIDKPKSKQPLPEHAKLVFKGKLFDVYQWEQIVFDGTIEIYEKLKRTDTVLVLPITPEGKIIITEQEQPGKEPFIGLAGGRAEENEDPLETAQRELLEETGYSSDEFILWDAQQPLSKIEWAVYIFIAKNCKKIQNPNLDNGEKIEIKEVTLEEFFELALEDNFAEMEIRLKVLEAKLDKKKMRELKKALSL